MNTCSVKLLPSLISANLMHLEDEIKRLEPYCDGFHIDIMDYHFVPNLTWGQAFIEYIGNTTKHPLTIHLMVSNPQSFCTTIKGRQSDTIIFHIESESSPDNTITAIREKNMKVGIALKPSTSLNSIKPYLSAIDELLLMSVHPGFSGQSFIPESFERLKEITQEKKEKKLTFLTSMDGGINETNIAQLVSDGMQAAGIAGAIFNKPDPINALIALRKICAT